MRLSLNKILVKLKKLIKPYFYQLKGKGSPRVISGESKTKNIIFLLPEQVKPAGGVIVSHHHSDTVNEIQHKNFHSQVFYPENHQHKVTKFVHNSLFKRDNKFDKNKDFVLIPEMMICRYAPKFIELGIKYGVHVQNGYSIGAELQAKIATIDDLRNAYDKADIIIGNSLDTIENIKTAFPHVTDKIIRSYFVINKARYQSVSYKKNIITYMPRKLGKHSQLVLLFIANRLPKHWSIKAIDGVTEQEVYDIFYESKIFLSFSELEGLAMPPAMAAMSGNKVIGYTGEANKEYFHLSCFEQVFCGDIKDFVNKILVAVERFDNDLEQVDTDSITFLNSLFSEVKQKQFIRELIDEVDKIL